MWDQQLYFKWFCGHSETLRLNNKPTFKNYKVINKKNHILYATPALIAL